MRQREYPPYRGRAAGCGRAVRLYPEEPAAGPWTLKPVAEIAPVIGAWPSGRPALLTVGGRSSAGKTTLAARICETTDEASSPSAPRPRRTPPLERSSPNLTDGTEGADEYLPRPRLTPPPSSCLMIPLLQTVGVAASDYKDMATLGHNLADAQAALETAEESWLALAIDDSSGVGRHPPATNLAPASNQFLLGPLEAAIVPSCSKMGTRSPTTLPGVPRQPGDPPGEAPTPKMREDHARVDPEPEDN